MTKNNSAKALLSRTTLLTTVSGRRA